ncbi:Bug family tripartite tricarboxylate transporter substrate binding protein [Muricoccus radiodurans]|uniref:Bug family tripartite tricarboxylate transporter substrate binding protein n=1 Tax=Muricoccus radiodurans TaxID=2231721 RepID=UPI003CE9D2EB
MIRLTRRTLAGAVLTLPSVARAQTPYPNRPVRVVIPFGPGGGSDNLARVIEAGVGRALGQVLVIETRPGAGGVIGTELVAHAEPNGYTVLLTDSSFTINPGLVPRLPYDSARDFLPVCHLASGSSVLLVHPSLPVHSVRDLVAWATARPGELSYASGGNGTGPHLAGELFKLATEIDMVHVPYRGTGPATNDVVAGHVPVMFNGASAVKPHVDAGRLRALAVTGLARNPALPDTPTFTEVGLPQIEASGHWGVLAPARTPEAVVRKLAEAFSTGVRDPAISPRLETLGFTVVGGGPADYAALIRNDTARWAEVIRRANIKPD